MEASTAADAEDDEIIKEIPIIHSKRLEDNLYLFQYPLNHSITTNQHKIKSCFFKPKNQEVKLELGIDTRSPNFDTGRAEIIAHEVDKESDKTKKNPKFFENEVVDKVFLQSSKTVQDANRYAVAVYNGKEVHLTSLSGSFIDLLYQFTKSQYVERKKVSSILKIPSEEIKEIFTGISKLRRHNKEWELHLPTDQDFINKHGDIVQKQNLMWEHRFHQLSQFLKDNMSQRRKSRSESKSVSEDG
uniref:DNA-directed RNA polymerase III subunit RPC5 n=1 Tax=Diabrotica virgifera virgifera TaxID=50390 RepID=A0A6P7GCB8_DIAVI